MSASGRIVHRAADYDFELPGELIAQHPAGNRDDARLMVVRRSDQSIHHAWFRDLPDLLRKDDCLVLNETRVLPARLVGYRKKTGGRWHGLYLEHDPETRIIRLMCKARGKMEPGETIVLQDREGADRLELQLASRLENGHWAAIFDANLEVEQVLKKIGRVPLPHYIRGGDMVEADVEDYQTVYARTPGSVAAPTAGLHFSESLLARLVDRGVRIAKLSLHVGTGTFKPITSDLIDDHSMHAERGEIKPQALELIRSTRSRSGRIIAVGSTSVRLLETIAREPAPHGWTGETSLFIKPGHEFRLVDCMITNFHLPRSTLLVMVRTFGGDALIRQAYEEAIAGKYRFFSYGDAMMIV